MASAGAVFQKEERNLTCSNNGSLSNGHHSTTEHVVKTNDFGERPSQMTKNDSSGSLDVYVTADESDTEKKSASIKQHQGRKEYDQQSSYSQCTMTMKNDANKPNTSKFATALEKPEIASDIHNDLTQHRLAGFPDQAKTLDPKSLKSMSTRLDELFNEMKRIVSQSGVSPFHDLKDAETQTPSTFECNTDYRQKESPFCLKLQTVQSESDPQCSDLLTKNPQLNAQLNPKMVEEYNANAKSSSLIEKEQIDLSSLAQQVAELTQAVRGIHIQLEKQSQKIQRLEVPSEKSCNTTRSNRSERNWYRYDGAYKCKICWDNRSFWKRESFEQHFKDVHQ